MPEATPRGPSTGGNGFGGSGGSGSVDCPAAPASLHTVLLQQYLRPPAHTKLPVWHTEMAGLDSAAEQASPGPDGVNGAADSAVVVASATSNAQSQLAFNEFNVMVCSSLFNGGWCCDLRRSSGGRSGVGRRLSLHWRRLAAGQCIARRGRLSHQTQRPRLAASGRSTVVVGMRCAAHVAAVFAQH
jgi:hypothetical protein